MDKIKLENAIVEAKKAIKWLVISGAALTFLNGMTIGLQGLQSGVLDFNTFLHNELIALAFMITNTLIYAISQYKDQ